MDDGRHRRHLQLRGATLKTRIALLICAALVASVAVDARPGWRGVAQLAVAATSPCGNSVLDGAEACDDGNTTAGDGCSAACAVESGWACYSTSLPSTCASFWLDVDADAGNQVSTSLTNFPSMTLALDCRGEGVSGTTLTCATGGAAPEAGSGGSPTSGLAVPLIGTTPRGFSVATDGKLYTLTDTSAGDVTTNDLAVEALFFAKHDGDGGYDKIIAKRDDAGTNPGWQLAINSAGQLHFFIDGGTPTQAATATVTLNAWNHVMCFMDSGSATGMQCFARGQAGTATDPTGVGSITTTDGARLGGTSFAAENMTGAIAFVRVWTGTGLASANYNAEYQERAERTFGAYPRLAVGSKASGDGAGNGGFISSTTRVDIDRDSDGVRRFFPVGIYQPAVARRKAANGTYYAGLLADATATNIWNNSEDATNAAWTKTQLAAVTSTTVASLILASPTKFSVELESTDAAGSTSHELQQSATMTAATWTYSCFVKAGSDSATHAYLQDSTSNVAAWFNLSTCAAASVSGSIATNASTLDMSYGNGWCRAQASWTGTAAAHTVKIGYTSTDGATSYDDGTDSTVDMYIAGCQMELGERATAPILTTGTTDVAGNDNEAYYSATSNAATSGTMDVKAVCPNYNLGTSTELLSLYTDANNVHRLIANATNDRSESIGKVSSSTQWDITASAGDMYDGNQHELGVSYATNAITFYRDASSDGTDSSASMLASLGTTQGIQVGSLAGATQSGCLITQVKFKPAAGTP